MVDFLAPFGTSHATIILKFRSLWQRNARFWDAVFFQGFGEFLWGPRPLRGIGLVAFLGLVECERDKGKVTYLGSVPEGGKLARS
jgi:hypothetical protein